MTTINAFLIKTLRKLTINNLQCLYVMRHFNIKISKLRI